jgi:hypothetical protein
MPSLTIRARRNVLLFHALSGALLASFVALHLANHALAFINLGDAFALMKTLRTVYRWPPVETLLIACVVYQVASGPVLARSRPAPASDKTEWATTASGYYLLFFVVLHTAAVFWGRYVAALDTNIYFAAAGLHAWPSTAFFSVYYFLAPVAVFVHLGQAMARRLSTRVRVKKHTWLAGAAVTGTVVAALIVAGLSGLGNGMQIPDEYMSIYRH